MDKHNLDSYINEMLARQEPEAQLTISCLYLVIRSLEPDLNRRTEMYNGALDLVDSLVTEIKADTKQEIGG